MSKNAQLPQSVVDKLKPTGSAADQRERDRQAYRVTQRIAPYSEGHLPDLSDFRPVRCHDISRGGISYYSLKPPLDEFLVVAVGTGPQTTYLTARVANCIRVEEDSDAMFRVGCEFLTRVDIPAEK